MNQEKKKEPTASMIIIGKDEKTVKQFEHFKSFVKEIEKIDIEAFGEEGKKYYKYGGMSVVSSTCFEKRLLLNNDILDRLIEYFRRNFSHALIGEYQGITIISKNEEILKFTFSGYSGSNQFVYGVGLFTHYFNTFDFTEKLFKLSMVAFANNHDIILYFLNIAIRDIHMKNWIFENNCAIFNQYAKCVKLIISNGSVTIHYSDELLYVWNTDTSRLITQFYVAYQTLFLKNNIPLNRASRNLKENQAYIDKCKKKIANAEERQTRLYEAYTRVYQKQDAEYKHQIAILDSLFD